MLSVFFCKSPAGMFSYGAEYDGHFRSYASCPLRACWAALNAAVLAQVFDQEPT